MSDSEEFLNVDVKTLRGFIYEVMCKLGVPEDDAQIVADVLIESDKRGIDSHGIARLKMYYDRLRSRQQLPTTELTIERETLGTAVLNANNGMGQVAAKRAMELAIEKAKRAGIGMVVVGHSNHFGIAGYYTNMAASKGMIGMCGTNARPSTAPTWGVDPLLGTNPFSVAIPTDWDFPWSADQATSTIQRGKIETYARVNKEAIPGWVINTDGTPETNPHEILDDLVKGTAALTPLGGIGEEMAGYKGYNYATFVEILSSVLQQSSFLRACSGFRDGKVSPFDLGHFFIAINIEAFVELEKFKESVGTLLHEIVNSKKMPNVDHIYVAGEKEHLASKRRCIEGIPISKVTRTEMLKMQAELELREYRFDFQSAIKPSQPNIHFSALSKTQNQ